MKIGGDTVASVTGGASGLGAATVRMLTGLGAQVLILDRDADRGAALADETGARFRPLDVSDAADIAAAFADIAETEGRLDLHVNCAGIAPAAKTISRGEVHDAYAFARVVAINLNGSFFCASHAALMMAANPPAAPDGERGVIVHTASIAAWDGQVGQAAYAASKGGVAGLVLPMARDLADKGIRVCAIAPGLFLTPMLEGLPDEVRESLGAQVPFPARLGDPGDYAALVRHIAENPMLNGETIRLDGAIRMAPR
ncbi:SDR family oxidoreductase [Rhodobacteraceae bacterium CCMM004]|nr:SDR family oxidoreductase [Rhodobacteraceae bacterium CCMM004]